MKQLPDFAAGKSLGRSKCNYRSPSSSGAGGTGIVSPQMEDTNLMDAEQSGSDGGSDDALDTAEGLDDLSEDMTGGNGGIEGESGEENDSEAEEESDEL